MSEIIFDKRILLVDDELDITNLIEEVLRKEGFFNIRKAHCGFSAIEMCKEENPDVIILDVMLPDIDGIEVCKRTLEVLH
jgi:DNA-binding response OmpR family regulator